MQMIEAEFEQEELILQEIYRLSKPLDGIPEISRANGAGEADVARLKALQEEVIQKTLAALKINKRAFSVTSLFDDSDDKAYWLSRSPEERLRHMEILRRINYGTQATARLQRVLELAQREES
jgi:hypothetical protein